MHNSNESTRNTPSSQRDSNVITDENSKNDYTDLENKHLNLEKDPKFVKNQMADGTLKNTENEQQSPPGANEILEGVQGQSSPEVCNNVQSIFSASCISDNKHSRDPVSDLDLLKNTLTTHP